MRLARFLAASLLLLVPLSACRDGSGPGPGGLRTRWTATHPEYSSARPAIVEGMVVAGTGDARLVALDQRTGAVRWSTPVLPEPVGGAQLPYAGGVVVAPLWQRTVGVEAATGTRLWTYEAPPDTVDSWGAPGQVLGTWPATDGLTAFIPAWGASVSAVDLARGVRRWVWQPGRAPTDTAPETVFRSGAEGVAVSGDTVYASAWHFVTRNGVRSEPWLVALDRRTGRELFRVAPPHVGSGVTVIGPPAVHDRLAYLTAVGGFVWAVDRFTGAVAWSRDLSDMYATDAGAIVHDGTLYVASGARRVVALDPATGAERWRSAALVAPSRALYASARRVYAVEGCCLWVIDRATGRTVRQVSPPLGGLNGLFATSVATAGSAAFVGLNGGVWSFTEP